MGALYGAFLSLFAGIGLALQPTFNAELARRTGTTLWASFFSISLSAFLVLVAIIAFRSPFMRFADVSLAPWWAWLGGTFGAVYVTATLWAVGKIGVSVSLTMVIAGQLLGAVVIDQYGLFNMDARPLNCQKLIGILLFAAGALMVFYSNRSI